MALRSLSIVAEAAWVFSARTIAAREKMELALLTLTGFGLLNNGRYPDRVLR